MKRRMLDKMYSIPNTHSITTEKKSLKKQIMRESLKMRQKMDDKRKIVGRQNRPIKANRKLVFEEK